MGKKSKIINPDAEISYANIFDSEGIVFIGFFPPLEGKHNIVYKETSWKRSIINSNFMNQSFKNVPALFFITILTHS